MSTAHETTAPSRTPIVPRLSPEELRRRNAEMMAILDEWESDPDAEDQRETMAVLRQALGPGRTISSRSAFRP